MATIQEIRRANLRALLDRSEWQQAPNAAPRLPCPSGPSFPAPVISQPLNRRMHSGGKVSGMGDDPARKLEAGMGKPQGWMDESHGESVVEHSGPAD